MKLFLTFVLSLSCLPVMTMSGQRCPDNGITAREYENRRKALVAITDTGSVVAMKGAEAGSEFEYMNYRQELNFLYLTGVDAPGFSLLIVPRGIELGGKKRNCILFSPALYLGASMTFSGSRLPYEQFSGLNDTVIKENEFHKLFLQALAGTRTLYYSAPGISFIDDWLNDKPYFLEKEVQKNLKQSFPGLKVAKVASLVGKMREIKSSAEIDMIRKAISLTGDGLEDAMRTCSPGIWEYELQASVEFPMTRQGAQRTAFRSIIGAGKNSLSPHYDDNHCQGKAGDVVVLDVGAEYNHYAADITRTIPVSGKFTDAQKTIYETVLQVQKQLIRLVRPGTTFSKIDEIANDLLNKAGYGKYILHGVTHPIGLDVHDIQVTNILKPGMVITIEPGLYIPEDDTLLAPAFRGFGIRLEDDVLVTEDGNELLSKKIPKETAEIERLMGKRK